MQRDNRHETTTKRNGHKETQNFHKRDSKWPETNRHKITLIIHLFTVGLLLFKKGGGLLKGLIVS